MEHYYKQFIKTLKNFISDLDRYVPNDGCKNFIKRFDEFNMHNVILRYEGMMREHEDKLKNMDESVFSNELLLFPGIELSQLWTQVKKEKKKKLFTYLHMLLVISDMMIKSAEDDTKKEEEFNPYLGVGNSSSALSVTEMYSANIPDDKPTKPGLGSLASMVGIDKMLNIKQLTDQLKNMKKEDIDEATNSIKNLLGNNVDDKTSDVISDMLTNIKNELGKDDITDGNPLDNIVKIAESVAAKIKPKMDQGGIDMHKLWSSTQNIANQCTDKNGNSLFGKGNMNPFDIVNKMMGPQNNNPIQNIIPQGMTEQEYINKCNDMFKNMGMNNLDLNNLKKK